MAEPVSALAMIGAVSALGGGALSAVGQLQAADAQGKAAAVEADAMQEQGRLTQFSAFEDAKQVRFQGNKLLAEQFFHDKPAAKKERDRLNAAGGSYVVTAGPDHRRYKA